MKEGKKENITMKGEKGIGQKGTKRNAKKRGYGRKGE